MEKLKLSGPAANKTIDSLGTPVSLMTIFIVIGVLAYFSLRYHFPVRTTMRYETGPTGNTYIFMLPAIIHMALLATILAVIGHFLTRRNAVSSRLHFLYWPLSLILVSFQILLIRAQANDPSPKYNWSILRPEKYLDQSVSAEIIKSAKKDEISVCDLLLNPDRSTLVSGVSSDGIKFSIYPTRAFALKALGGEVPAPCTKIASFEAARKIADYYPSLNWFSRQCNAQNQTEPCTTTQRNLIEYGAPGKINWRESRFFVTQNIYQLEFVATPDKGILFVKELPVKNTSLGSQELQKLATEAESIKQYDAYYFDCAGEKYAKFSRPFNADGDQLRNWQEKLSELSFKPLPKENSAIDGYYRITCK